MIKYFKILSRNITNVRPNITAESKTQDTKKIQLPNEIKLDTTVKSIEFPKNSDDLFNQVVKYKNIQLLNFEKYIKSPNDTTIKNDSLNFLKNSNLLKIEKLKKEYDQIILSEKNIKRYNVIESIRNLITDYFKFINGDLKNSKYIKLESNFLKHTIDLKRGLDDSNININIKNVNNLNINILETTHITGTFLERSLNPFIQNIYLYNNEEKNGLIEYKINNNNNNSLLYLLTDIEDEVLLRLVVEVSDIEGIEIKKNDKIIEEIKTNKLYFSVENLLKRPIEEVFIYKNSKINILEYYKLGDFYITDLNGSFKNTLFKNNKSAIDKCHLFN